MRNKVLIIGSKGMLGQDMTKEFEASYNWDTFSVDIERVDITQRSSVDFIIDKYEPQAVINCAAYNAVDRCEVEDEEFKLAMRVNAEGPGNIAEICAQRNIIFFHFSTDYVFDGQKGEYVENDQPNPINRYGQTKYEGEKKVIGFGGKFYLARVSKLFGKTGRSLMAKKSFFDKMISFAKENKTLKVVDDELSCFCYTPDIAAEVRKIIEQGAPYGIYHIVNEHPCTWYEAACELFKLINFKVEVIPVSAEEFPRPAKRPKSSVLLNTKLKPLRPYFEALEEYISKEYLLL